MATYYDEGFDPNDLTITVSEMLVATADESDELIDEAVSEVLALLRQRLAMDVVFVSEFVDGQRLFRQVSAGSGVTAPGVGDGDPLEQTWCQRVVDGRIPPFIPDVSAFPHPEELPPTQFDVGTYLSTPIHLTDGRVYGTLCCYSVSPNENIQQRDLKNLKSVAQLVAKKIDKGH